MDKLKKCAEHLFEERPEEDYVDRTNNSVTTYILYTSALLIFAKEYGPFSEPLHCWSQAEWGDDWMEYAHDYCFVESTYYVPINETVPVRGQRNNGSDRVSYYQWVPFILVAMAFFNQWPHYLWRFFNMVSKKNLPAILGQSSTAVYHEEERRIATGIGRHLHVALAQSEWGDPMLVINWNKERRKSPPGAKMWHLIRRAWARNCLASGYLLVKAAYLVTNIAQFKFISTFLGIERTAWWGWETLNNFMTQGSAWERSGLFPRVSLCDLKIRQPGERFHDFTVQCVLMANYLNEKIFTVLYCWFVLMALISLVNFLFWAWTLHISSNDRFVRQLFELSILQLYPDPEFAKEEEENEPSATEGPMRTTHGELPGGMTNRHPSSARGHNCVSAAVSNTLSNATTTTSASADSGMSAGSTIASAANMVLVPIEPHGSVTDQLEQSGGHPVPPPFSASPSPPLLTLCSPSTGMVARRRLRHHSTLSPQEATLSRIVTERNKFHAEFKQNEEKFIALLGTDGILAFKLMCSNANLQVASLIMGELFNAFCAHELLKQKRAREESQERRRARLLPV